MPQTKLSSERLGGGGEMSICGPNIALCVVLTVDVCSCGHAQMLYMVT